MEGFIENENTGDTVCSVCKEVIKNLKAGNYKVQVRVMIKQYSKKAYSNSTQTNKVKVK